MTKLYVASEWDVDSNPTTPQQLLANLIAITGREWSMEVLPSKNIMMTLQGTQGAVFLNRMHQGDTFGVRRIPGGGSTYMRVWFKEGLLNENGEEKCFYELLYQHDHFKTQTAELNQKNPL